MVKKLNTVPNSDFMEVVDEITTQIVEESFGESGYEETTDNEDIRWTEEAQDFYNTRYDEIESLLIRFLKLKITDK